MEEELNEYIQNSIASLEAKRQRIIRQKRIFIPIKKFLKVIAFVCFILGIFLPPFAISTIILGLLIYFCFNFQDRFNKHVKKNFLPSFFQNINASYTYKHKGYSQYALHQSGIFSKSLFTDSSIKGEDYITGKIGNVTVEFFELTTRKRDSDIEIEGFAAFLYGLYCLIFRKKIEKKRTFKGFCMLADFNKDFTAKTMMFPKEKEKFSDKVSSLLVGKKYTKLSLEHPFIQKKYNAYTTDTQAAFYVLSPKLLDSIIDVYHLENVLPMVSFFESKMFIVIPWERNNFEFDIEKPISDISYFDTYLREIETFEKLIQHFNLEQRIWSKE